MFPFVASIGTQEAQENKKIVRVGSVRLREKFLMPHRPLSINVYIFIVFGI
jgi:hypothetical protein